MLENLKNPCECGDTFKDTDDCIHCGCYFKAREYQAKCSILRDVMEGLNKPCPYDPYTENGQLKHFGKTKRQCNDCWRELEAKLKEVE